MSKTGSWSKYGGARIQINESQYGLEQTGDKWFCQSCGEEMPKDLPPYRVEFLPGEYFRVCSTCLNKKCDIYVERRLHIIWEERH